MKAKIIRKHEHTTSTWSGGTTTQLYIYPTNADYAKRDFLFRISSAKVEVAESVFTSLPGIDREIMIIDGTLKLEHEGHHSITLNKFDKDSFKGDWTTKSYGKVVDFNLMTNNKCIGNITHININPSTNKQINNNQSSFNNQPTDNREENKISAIYCVNGELIININERTSKLNTKDKNINNPIQLYEGDLLVLENIDKEKNTRINNINNTILENNITQSNNRDQQKTYTLEIANNTNYEANIIISEIYLRD